MVPFPIKLKKQGKKEAEKMTDLSACVLAALVATILCFDSIYQSVLMLSSGSSLVVSWFEGGEVLERKGNKRGQSYKAHDLQLSQR